jgi:hypothetical protein
MMTETCKLQFVVANKLPTIVDKLSLLVVLKLACVLLRPPGAKGLRKNKGERERGGRL